MEDYDSLTRYGGMVGDDEDDEVERSVVGIEKGSKRGPSQYVHTSIVHVSNRKLMMNPVIVPKDRSGGIHSLYTMQSLWWNRKKWKLEHLPKGTSEVSTNQLVPLAKSLAGSLSPWEGCSRCAN